MCGACYIVLRSFKVSLFPSMIAVLNAQQDRARKLRRTLSYKPPISGTSRGKQVSVKKDHASSNQNVRALSDEMNSTSLISPSASDFSDCLSDGHIIFESVEDKWHYISACLLRRHPQGNNADNYFMKDVTHYFKLIRSCSSLSAQEKRTCYDSYFKRASTAGILQTADAEEILSVQDLNHIRQLQSDLLSL